MRIVIALCVIAVLAGCGGNAGVPSESSRGTGWAAEFADALDASTSDFEREVLADGVVTLEEYTDAHALWVSCIEETYPPETGIALNLIPNPNGTLNLSATGTFEGVDDAFFNAVVDQCRVGAIENIDYLYPSVLVNPEYRPWEDLLVECFVRNEVVPEDYTVDDLIADWNGASGNEGTNSAGPDMSDVRVAECLNDPRN